MSKQKEKKDKTIRSETTKVFVVIFLILVLVGFFNVLSSLKGMDTFETIEQTYLEQYSAAENMGKLAADIISLAYLLAGDHELNLLMEEMVKYDDLVREFERSTEAFAKLLKESPTENTPNLEKALKNTKEYFANMNLSARDMTISIMEGDKKRSRVAFGLMNKQIIEFKTNIQAMIVGVEADLKKATNKAKENLYYTSILGVVVIVLAAFVTIGLIYYLMRFLSISLLPISNLMHNLRQAVFSIDKTGTIVSPVSAYSSSVLGKEIVGEHVNDIVFKDIPANSEEATGIYSAMSVVFDEDEIQWVAMEDCWPQIVEYKSEDKDLILKLTYTPLMDKQDNTQSIMIVAEDVTEVEKLRIEAKQKQGEVAIIQSMLAMDGDDLQAFLLGAESLLANAFNSLYEVYQSTDVGAGMFRDLHTIKGNSRMFALGVLSEITHQAESVLSAIIKKQTGGKAVGVNLMTDLRDNLAKVELSLALHAQIASRFIGIANRLKPLVWWRCYSLMGYLEIEAESGWWWTEHVEVDGAVKFNDLWRGAYSHGSTLMSEVKECLHYLELNELAEKLASLTYGEESDAEAMRQISQEFVKEYSSNPKQQLFSVDSTIWSKVFKFAIDLHKLAKNGIDSENQLDVHSQTLKLQIIGAIEGIKYLECLAVQVLQSLESLKTDDALKYVRNIFRYSLINIYIDKGLINAKNSAIDPENGCGISLGFDLACAEYELDQKAVITTWLEFVESENCSAMADTVLLGFSLDKELNVVSFGEGENALEITDLIPEELSQGLLGLDLLYRECKRMVGTLTGQLGQSDDDEADRDIEFSFSKVMEMQGLVSDIENGIEIPKNCKTLSKIITSSVQYPVSKLFENVRSVITDMSKNLGKSVNFEYDDGDHSIDRGVAGTLRDSIVHLVRNSMDHGLETSSERVAAGKPEFGMFKLECSQSNMGKNLIVKVIDDGRGIDSERLKVKALESGVIDQAKADALDHKESLELIFMSGLSSKSEVTAFSGRGVGMDAVRVAINSLGGTIGISSELGKGTQILIDVPINERDNPSMLRPA